MCYKGKCLYCIPVQTACMVLAIINVLISITVALYGFVFWGMLLVFVASTGPALGKTDGVSFKREKTDDDVTWLAGGFTIVFIIIPLFGILNIIFSSILCHGICKPRPKLVKVYFWYGIVITVLLTIASVVMLCYDHKSFHQHGTFEAYLETSDMASGGLLILIGCVYHSLFLVLVHFTHKKLLQDSINDPIRLEKMRDSDDTRLVTDHVINKDISSN